MRILGIETSCDETSAAVVEETGDPSRPWAIRSNVDRLAGRRSTANGAGSCRSSRRVSTSATSAAWSSARSRRPDDAGAISALSPSRRVRGWSGRCSSASRSPKPAPRPPACRWSPCIIWPVISNRSCCRTASCRCPPSCWSCRAGTRACISSSGPATISCSAGPATMRRERRTTRSPSCLDWDIPGGR